MSIPVFGMSDPDFKSALKRTKKAILPVGSLEQHGRHLPVSTDSLIAEHIARMAAERAGAFVLILCDMDWVLNPMATMETWVLCSTLRTN